MNTLGEISYVDNIARNPACRGWWEIRSPRGELILRVADRRRTFIPMRIDEISSIARRAFARRIRLVDATAGYRIVAVAED